MNKDIRNVVKQLLDDYLETNKLRKTPERYAILEAVYSLEGHFSIEDIDEYLSKNNFRVSRATLYNNMRLFMKLRFVVCHRLQSGTKYESSYDNNHCHQICTVCGKVTEMNLPDVMDVINKTKLKRFRKDSFALYIYGMCSTCQTRLSKRKKTKINSKDIKTE